MGRTDQFSTNLAQWKAGLGLIKKKIQRADGHGPQRRIEFAVGQQVYLAVRSSRGHYSTTEI